MLDRLQNDSSIVTYVIAGQTTDGLCSLRLKANVVAHTSALLRAPINYMDLVNVFLPRLNIRNGQQEVTLQYVDSGAVVERPVVQGVRKFAVVNLRTRQKYIDLDDNMIGMVSAAEQDAHRRSLLASHGPIL